MQRPLVAGFLVRGRIAGMKHPRFALRSLFIFLTLAVAFFGFRNGGGSASCEARELESQGFTLLIATTPVAVVLGWRFGR
jgi:hypothetical protein